MIARPIIRTDNEQSAKLTVRLTDNRLKEEVKNGQCLVIRSIQDERIARSESWVTSF